MSERPGPPFVLFVAAAGPRLGFGHLTRCATLADALGCRREIVLRGPASARYAALRFGWTVHQGSDVVGDLMPDLVIVDDPSRADTVRWVHMARRAHVPAAAIADAAKMPVPADLVIDGGLAAAPADRFDRAAGPAFALLHPRVAARRARHGQRRSGRVLIALGGGAHVRRIGVSIAAALARLSPAAQVGIAAGFAFDGPLPALPARCRWVVAPNGLHEHLATAAVAIVAGGITLCEACALGAPAVAVAVAPAQRHAIAAAAASGAVVAASPREAARAAAALLASPARAARLSRRAQRLVDGAGTARVVSRLQALLADPRGRWSHAA